MVPLKIGKRVLVKDASPLRPALGSAAAFLDLVVDMSAMGSASFSDAGGH